MDYFYILVSSFIISTNLNGFVASLDNPYSSYRFDSNNLNIYNGLCKYKFRDNFFLGIYFYLLNDYNMLITWSVSTLINKSDLDLLFAMVDNDYLNFIYYFYSLHRDEFPLTFDKHTQSIKSAIERLIVRLWSIKRYTPRTLQYVRWIRGKMGCILSCTEKLKSSLESYLTELKSNTKCYIERLITSITCVIPRGGENLYIQNLNVKLKTHKEELILFIESKIELLENIMKDVDNFCIIESNLYTLCNSICSDICKLRGILCHLDKHSIKNEIDMLDCLVDKYITSLNDIYSKINLSLRSGSLLCDTCGLVYKISQIKTSIESKIRCFKYSVEIDIRGIGINMSCQSQPLMLDIKCEVPCLSSITSQSADLESRLCKIVSCTGYIICCLKDIKCFIYYRLNNVRYVKHVIRKPESIIESFLKSSIKCNILNLKRFDDLISNGNRSIGRNYITRSNLSTESMSISKRHSHSLIYNIMSNMTIVENKLAISRLYEHYMTRKRILMTLQYANNCRCVFAHKCHFEDDHPYQTMSSIFIHSAKHKKLHRSNSNNDGNTLCLCLVIIYHLYPNLIRCFCYLRDLEFDILSTRNRKFDKYTHSSSYNIRISKFILSIIDLYSLICDWIESRNPDPVKLKKRYVCFCINSQDVTYKFLISTIIYISFVVENMFDHQNETTRDSIQTLSALKAELEHDKVNITPVLKHTEII